MKRTLILSILSLFVSYVVHSQSFEWAASGGNIYSGFSHSCVTVDGRLIAGQQVDELSYNPMGGSRELYDAAGSTRKLAHGGRQMLVVCYNAQGAIDWMLDGQSPIGSGFLSGISSRPDGTVIVAFSCSDLRYSCTYMNPQTGRPFNTDSLFGNSDDYYRKSQINQQFQFFATINSYGQIQDIHALPKEFTAEWNSFEVLPDHSMLISATDDRKATDKSGRERDVAHQFTVHIDRNWTYRWKHHVMYLDESCCSYFTNAAGAVAGPQGEVYIYGSARGGARPLGGKDQMFENRNPLKPDGKRDLPVESFIGKINPAGKLDWIKYSGGFVLLRDLSVKNGQLVAGGECMGWDKPFGKSIDTTAEKRGLLFAMDLSGGMQWMQSFNAKSINSVAQDDEGGIYAYFRSQRSFGKAPLKIGKDTLSETWERVVVASFEADGTYRWSRTSKASISHNALSHLHTDACGNLYLTSEMWYVLPVNMSLFDAAIVTGKGYGGAPLAAKIRTRIPDNLLALNVQLSQSYQLKRKEKPRSETTFVSNSNSPKGKNNPVPIAQIPAPDTVRNGRATFCVPIPYPWAIEVFPNPSKGPVTLRCLVSYSDDKVQLDLMDARGNLVRHLMPPQLKETGSFDFPVDCSDLAAGIYIAVLRGTAVAATTRISIIH